MCTENLEILKMMLNAVAGRHWLKIASRYGVTKYLKPLF